jgi:hypothetical protein
MIEAVLTALTHRHLVIPLLVAVQVQVSLAVQAVAVIVQIDRMGVLVLRGKVIMVVLLLVVTILPALVVAVQVGQVQVQDPEVRVVLDFKYPLMAQQLTMQVVVVALL